MSNLCFALLIIYLIRFVSSNDLDCFNQKCSGPKFRQSECCDGYICVSNWSTEKGELECVDEEEHLKVTDAIGSESFEDKIEYFQAVLDDVENILKMHGIKYAPENHDYAPRRYISHFTHKGFVNEPEFEQFSNPKVIEGVTLVGLNATAK